MISKCCFKKRLYFVSINDKYRFFTMSAIYKNSSPFQKIDQNRSCQETKSSNFQRHKRISWRDTISNSNHVMIRRMKVLNIHYFLTLCLSYFFIHWTNTHTHADHDNRFSSNNQFFSISEITLLRYTVWAAYIETRSIIKVFVTTTSCHSCLLYH